MCSYDWAGINQELINSLRINTSPVGLKYLRKRDELNQIEKVRIQDKTLAPCVLIGQATQFNWTTAGRCESIHTDYCRCIHGMAEKDEKFCSGGIFNNVWYNNSEAAGKHNQQLDCINGKFEALVVSPLASGRIPDPDVCLMYLNTSQAFLLLAGYQHETYEKLQFTFSGESSCADSWVATFNTGKPMLSIPCYAERKFAGVRDNEVAVSFKPKDLLIALKGIRFLFGKGLRYPIAPYSLNVDMRAGLPQSYYDY